MPLLFAPRIPYYTSYIIFHLYLLTNNHAVHYASCSRYFYFAAIPTAQDFAPRDIDAQNKLRVLGR